MTSMEERIAPWALTCLEGTLKAVSMASVEPGCQFQVCAIIYDPAQPDIHIVSDEACGLEGSVLADLQRFLGKLLGPSNSVKSYADFEDERELEKEDYLAEAELQEEMERMAAEDPDVIELEQNEFAKVVETSFESSSVEATFQEETEEMATEDSDIVAFERDEFTKVDGTVFKPLSTETETDFNQEEMESIATEGLDTITFAHDEFTEAAKTAFEPPSAQSKDDNGSKLSSKRSRAGDGRSNPASPKRIRTRQVLDCVLIPTSFKFKQRTLYSISDSSDSDDTSDFGHSLTVPASSVSSQLPLQPPIQTLELHDSSSYSFVLTDQERDALGKPTASSAIVNTDLYMRFTFDIDMTKVPGRDRQASNQKTGKTAKQIDRVSVKQDETSIPVSNHLIRDCDLSSINCAYLSDYDIIVCQNIHDGKICGYGVPLACLFIHCSGSDKKPNLSNTSNRVPHGIPFCRKKRSYTPVQKQFIQRVLARYPNVVVSIPEMRDLRMRKDQFGPIAHIGDPIPGYACCHCDFALCDATKDGSVPLSIQEHWRHHRLASPNDFPQYPRKFDLRASKDFRSCSVQSFDRDRCNTLWLPVPPGQYAQPIKSGTSYTHLLLSANSHQLLQPHIPVSTNLSRSAILPFFLQNGAYDLICPLDPSEIGNLIKLPCKEEQGFRDLKLAILDRFKTLCNTIPALPDQFRKLLVAPTLGQRAMVDRFNRPIRNTTIQSYALEEVRLLCFVLRCIKSNKYAVGASKSPVSSEEGLHIGITSQQFNCFQALSEFLASTSVGEAKKLVSLIDAALRSLYMPTNALYLFDNIFRNPCTIYAILRSTQAHGGFANPKEITVYYARIQFGIRLTLMEAIQERHQQIQETNSGHEDEDESDKTYEQFMEYVRLIVTRWGSEEHISPLAFVRGCLRAMSRLARRAPSSQTVMWNGDGTRLAVQNHTVDISEYVDRVHRCLSALNSKVENDILFGIKFPQGSFDLPSQTSETNDLETPGFGLFTFNADVASEDHPAAYFLHQLCKRGQLCIRQEDEIIWDIKRLNDWLLAISKVWSETLTLMHLLSLPGRGTEVTTWQHANSPTSSRHLFLSKSLDTLITHSSYNKTTALTGEYKYILRVIPCALSTIITKLLRIVRPVESLAFTSTQAITEDKEEIKNLYMTYIFVSHGKVWDSSKLSASLRTWFVRELNVPFGLHLHRHFAQALQRKFLSYNETNKLYETANKVMGHGGELADLHYAREPHDLLLDTSERHRMEHVGRDWISKVHRLDVSPAADE